MPDEFLKQISDPEDGFECMIFHRGKWRHVRWSKTHRGWHLGYGAPFVPVQETLILAPLPNQKIKTDFYGWKN